MYIPPTIGERIKRERKEQGIAREVLAEMAGISNDTLWNIERGLTKRPYPRTVSNIAKALGYKSPRILLNAVESRRRYEEEQKQLLKMGVEGVKQSGTIGDAAIHIRDARSALRGEEK